MLFTCYNVSLGDWIREQFRQDQHPAILNIDVAQYHKLAHDFCSRAGVVVPREPSEDLDHYFSVVMPEALQEALDSLSDRFDAIIVDEGQDFKDLWWLTLIELLKDRDHGIFYIFYDDNQRIYQRENNFPFNEPQFPLYKNCRNTDRIHRRVVRYHKGTPKPRSSGLEGPEPEIVPVENGNRIETLRKVFTRLFTEEHIPADQVVILTPRSGTSDFKRGTKIGTKTLTWNKRPGANEVRVCSIHSFKGLESPVVILAELDRFHPESPQDELLYVATSRAQSHLIVLGELPEPVIQAQLGSPAESDLVGNAEGIAEDIELDLDIAAEAVVQPVPNDEIAPVVASEVAVEPSAESEVIEVVAASGSDVIVDPAALTEADEAAAVPVTSSVPDSVTQSNTPFESTELRQSLPSPNSGRGDGGEGPISEPLALPASANGASSTQESADRAVKERPRTVSQSAPGTPRPSWSGQADDPRHWSAPVERDQPRSSTRSPTNSPPSSGVGGVGKPPKTGDGEALSVNPPGNGWAVAGLLCGILALFIHVLAIAAIIVAGIGLSKAKGHGGRGKAAGWIGLALGVIVVLGMLQ
ncbi:MAG TPA: ATP-binding domain-containing protein [Nitrolancea sp.]|nr:ATP-binding domain-containing protein [Nitrolancea sp.]